MTVAAMVLALITLAIAAVVLYKVRRIHLLLHAMRDEGAEQLAAHFAQVDALLALYREPGFHHGLPATRGWAGSPDFLLQLYWSARELRPHCIVECGSGTSTVLLACVLRDAGAGHVYSLESSTAFAERTRTELRRRGLESVATVIDAPLMRYEIDGTDWQWYSTEALPERIDMLVVDGPPGATQARARFPAIALLGGRLCRGGVVVLDDANRADERAIVATWLTDSGYEQLNVPSTEKGVAVLRKRT